MGTEAVLELFHLLLANTAQTDCLVYVFSQPSLHAFFFQHFRLEQQPPELVEYYAQLLKTIVLKVNSGQASLIKLFCNNRHPCFPLLAQATSLAAHATEELVKVTAQQCVLLLIGLLARKRVGEGYLVEAQLALFYHEVTLQLLPAADREGAIKYVVDLVTALQTCPASVGMLMNCFIVNVVLPSLSDLPLLLTVVRQWSQALE
jgi:hypothetical protein